MCKYGIEAKLLFLFQSKLILTERCNNYEIRFTFMEKWAYQAQASCQAGYVNSIIWCKISKYNLKTNIKQINKKKQDIL
jgi:hypothetical protein